MSQGRVHGASSVVGGQCMVMGRVKERLWAVRTQTGLRVHLSGSGVGGSMSMFLQCNRMYGLCLCGGAQEDGLCGGA